MMKLIQFLVGVGIGYVVASTIYLLFLLIEKF